jgi:hypothetical protein
VLLPDTRNGIARANYRLAVEASIASKTVADFTKTKAALAAAEAAGRPDTFVADAVANYEKQVAQNAQAALDAAKRAAESVEESSSVDVGRLSRQLQKGSISQRVDAANALAAAGADAAEVLGYALETDSIISVRQAAVRSLGRMGSGARKALPAMSRYIRTMPSVTTEGTADDIQREIMESDMRNDIKAIIAKLR